MKKNELHPEIFTLEPFLSKQECDQWIKKMSDFHFEESLIQSGGKQVMNKAVRNNERYLFFDQDLADVLWNRLQPYFPKKIDQAHPIGLNEMLRIYKYVKGQRFKMHKDGSYKRNNKEFSLYSLIIFLNTNFEGGETAFRKLFSVSPEHGKALLFQHRLRHEGQEVSEGVKYVLRTDVMFKLR